MKQPRRRTLELGDAALGDLLAETPRTEDVLRCIGGAARDYEADPEFVADFAKGQLVEDVLLAMERAGMTRSDLARKLGKTRQYVTRVLNEQANFTIETMAAFAGALGMRLTVRLLPRDEAAALLPKAIRTPRAAAEHPGTYKPRMQP